jgi:hypothetical protein
MCYGLRTKLRKRTEYLLAGVFADSRNSDAMRDGRGARLSR